MRYLMSPEYERAGLPEALLFGIMAKESGGKVHAVSRAGASGPLQFMPATGTRFGLYRDGTGFDTRFDPQQSARANAAYINERFAELNRNLEYTIAAYNGGEGRAARLYRANGGASFWSPQVIRAAAGRDARLRAGGDRRGLAVPASEEVRPGVPEDRHHARASSRWRAHRRSTN